MSTKIKIKDTHDRMSFLANFANGDVLKFNITRYRDSLIVEQPKNSTGKIGKEDLQALQDWLQLREEEIHMQRFERLKSVCEKAATLEGLILLVSLEA